MIIRLPIDIKSLYSNILNDNQVGHTATVATPLKQGKSVHKELAKIRCIPENISDRSRENLIERILSNSRADAIITDVYVFDKVTVNNIPINCDASFCIYIREETNPKNVHFGRQKVHYPPSLKYSDSDVDIDNRSVIKTISETLHNYAFVVEAFEYNSTTKTLNFDVLIVGENSIPYSKVFRNKKGVGNKFTSVFNEYADSYDSEVICLREYLGYDVVYPDNFMEIMKLNRYSSIEYVISDLHKQSIRSVRNISDDYPYSLYNIAYFDNENKKKYVIVSFTATKNRSFVLSNKIIRFINDFYGSVYVALVTNIIEKPEIKWYSVNEINTMKKTIMSIKFNDDRGV